MIEARAVRWGKVFRFSICGCLRGTNLGETFNRERAPTAHPTVEQQKKSNRTCEQMNPSIISRTSMSVQTLRNTWSKFKSPWSLHTLLELDFFIRTRVSSPCRAPPGCPQTFPRHESRSISRLKTNFGELSTAVAPLSSAGTTCHTALANVTLRYFRTSTPTDPSQHCHAQIALPFATDHQKTTDARTESMRCGFGRQS